MPLLEREDLVFFAVIMSRSALASFVAQQLTPESGTFKQLLAYSLVGPKFELVPTIELLGRRLRQTGIALESGPLLSYASEVIIAVGIGWLPERSEVCQYRL